MAEQNNSDPESMANKPPVPPRDDLVNTAAKFLSSPNVQKSPNDMKIAFLKKKGLSDVEIELALKKCQDVLNTRVQVLDSISYPVQYQPLGAPTNWYRNARWITFRDIVNTLMILAGFSYGLYWIYKKYIWNYLFGKRGKKITNEDRLTDIEANLTSVCRNIDSFKASMEIKGVLLKEIHQVKEEVASVKKLLLSRKQFPSAGAAPISIPSWQIASASVDDKEEEGAATNGSDSSLEMIKE